MQCYDKLMSVLSAATRARLETRLTELDASIATAQATLDKLLDVTNESYKFSAGDGSQAVTKRTPEELLKVLDILQRQRDAVANRLAGAGVVNLNVRRKY